MEIKAGRLQHMLRILSRFSEDAIVTTRDGVMSSRVVEYGHSVYVDVSLKDDRICEGDDIGVDLKKFKSFLDVADANDVIDVGSDGRLTRGHDEYKMSLIPIESVRRCIDIPEMECDVCISMTGKEFKYIVKYASSVSDDDTVTFQADSIGMRFIARNREANELYTHCFCGICDGTGASIYNLEYLRDIATDMRVADTCEVRFSRDYPCEIVYERDDVSVRFVIAPRIGTD